MSQRRTWVAGAAAVTALLVIASYFLAIHPKMAEASDLRVQKATAAAANDQLRLDIAQLKAQFSTLPVKQAELAVVQQQMPPTPNLPTLIRNLTSMAGESGVSLNAIAPSVPTSASGTSGTAVATPGLYDIPLTITVQGDFASNELFLQKIQTQMRRAFLVQNLSIAKATSMPGNAAGTPANGQILVTLSGSVFVLQPTATATVGAAGTAAGATPSTTASAN